MTYLVSYLYSLNYHHSASKASSGCLQLTKLIVPCSVIAIIKSAAWLYYALQTGLPKLIDFIGLSDPSIDQNFIVLSRLDVMN